MDCDDFDVEAVMARISSYSNDVDVSSTPSCEGGGTSRSTSSCTSALPVDEEGDEEDYDSDVDCFDHHDEDFGCLEELSMEDKAVADMMSRDVSAVSVGSTGRRGELLLFTEAERTKKTCIHCKSTREAMNADSTIARNAFVFDIRLFKVSITKVYVLFVMLLILLIALLYLNQQRNRCQRECKIKDCLDTLRFDAMVDCRTKFWNDTPTAKLRRQRIRNILREAREEFDTRCQEKTIDPSDFPNSFVFLLEGKIICEKAFVNLIGLANCDGEKTRPWINEVRNFSLGRSSC